MNPYRLILKIASTLVNENVKTQKIVGISLVYRFINPAFKNGEYYTKVSITCVCVC